eukprot:1142451-Pelagomonas_calceolata.AAC.2
MVTHFHTTSTYYLYYLTSLTDKLENTHARKTQALLIPLPPITIAGRGLTTSYSPLPQIPLSIWKLTTHSLNLPTKKSATPSGITQRSPLDIRSMY